MSQMTKEEVEEFETQYDIMLKAHGKGEIDNLTFFLKTSMIIHGLFGATKEYIERANKAESKLIARKVEDWITGRVGRLISRAWDGDMSDDLIEKAQAIEDYLWKTGNND